MEFLLKQIHNYGVRLINWILNMFFQVVKPIISRFIHRKMYSVLEQIPLQTVRRGHIPPNLNRRLSIVNVPGISNISNTKEKCDAALAAHCQAGTWGGACSQDLVIFDILSVSGNYFPTVHTDTEWNKVQNDGFQVWILEHNHNKTRKGNMFFFTNPVIDRKYGNHGIGVRLCQGRIVITKNCFDKLNPMYVLGFTISPEHVLGYMSVDEFVATTHRYYLDAEPDDVVVFAKDLMHCSDYRDTSLKRVAMNFRVAHALDGDLVLGGCGVVKSLPFHKGHRLRVKRYDLI